MNVEMILNQVFGYIQYKINYLYFLQLLYTVDL